MEYKNRIEIYKTIEEYRKRPLVVYVTSTRTNVSGMMAGDAVRYLIDQVDAIQEGNAVDVLLHSAGGDALTAWKLMSVLRERFEKISVLVPFEAFSAATVFALGADEIVMHPHGSLGPIDPQITVRNKDGNQKHFAYEDARAFLKFIREEANIGDPKSVGILVEQLTESADPLILGWAKRASDLATDVGERLLRTHMKDSDSVKPRTIAENLNKNFFAHSDAVSRSRAKELELPIAESDPCLEKLMWKAFLGIEEYLSLGLAFDAHLIYMSDSSRRIALKLPGPILLPQNMPQQLIDQALNVAFNQALTRSAQGSSAAPYSVIHALIESSRLGFECFTDGEIHLNGIVGGGPSYNIMPIKSGWRKYEEEVS